MLPEVVLTSGAKSIKPAKEGEFQAAGIRVQFVPVHTVERFEYRWIGNTHYLAFHDLNLTDGETFADGANGTLADRRRDLRGTLTFVPARCRIWGWSMPRALDQSFTALYLDAERMEDEVAQRLRNLPSQPLLYFSNAALRSTLMKISDALQLNAQGDSLYLESLCVLAVAELCVAQKEKLAATARPAGRLARSTEQKIADFVEANLCSDIGLDDLAGIAGLSRFHFLRSFKRTTDETPYQYLMHRRLDRAERLLGKNGLSVADVAAAVGFKDATRFIRAFRRAKGVTPGKYR